MKQDKRPDEEWIDANILGSHYQQQIDLRSGRFRHRLQWHSMITGEDRTADTPWISGVAPKAEPRGA